MGRPAEPEGALREDPAARSAAPATPGAAALFVACAALYLCTAPGRIHLPDDEIVFQTTASLVERGSLAIAGIPWRTGEPEGLPAGTFGTAEGRDGQRYGFFGHGLSLVAVPGYALAAATAPIVPFAWTRAVRSDHLTYHVRSPRADWTRTVVSLTHCFTTAATAWALVRWLAWVGLSGRAALWTGVAFATATAAWPYARSFLSEPLSALVLLLAALAIAQAHALQAGEPRAANRRLWLAGAAAGFSVHVHVLNVVAWPCLLAYALAPVIVAGRSDRRGGWRRALERARGGLLGALLLAGAGLGLLLLGHWLRFGDPLETGRYGLYSSWTAPWTGLWALMAAPGRSFWLYSPAAALGLWGARTALSGMSSGTGVGKMPEGAGWPGAPAARIGARAMSGGMSAGTEGGKMPEGTGWTRGRAIAGAAWFALASLATRWLFVSARTDWFGGWCVGPRYLVPALPVVMIGFAVAVERLPQRRRAARWLFWIGLLVGALLMGRLATRSIHEWMMMVKNDPRVTEGSFMAAAHFEGWASPIFGVGRLAPDVLSLGAIKVARAGYPGLLLMFAAVAAVGAGAGLRVGRALWRLRGGTGRYSQEGEDRPKEALRGRS